MYQGSIKRNFQEPVLILREIGIYIIGDDDEVGNPVPLDDLSNPWKSLPR
jgi:hypothetical protein